MGEWRLVSGVASFGGLAAAFISAHPVFVPFSTSV
jgi:hypothetical protein